MTKIFVPLPEKEKISFYLHHSIDGFFIGIKNFSINFNNYVEINDLKFYIDTIKKENKKAFISFNKLFYNSQIDEVKKALIEIEKYDIDGVLFCDVSIYNIVKENKLKINLIWDSYHLGTNYKTINFWYDRGVKTTLLSSEITIDEVLEINKNTNANVGLILYGYLNMATSSRSLITNYFKYINKYKKNDKYLMYENINDEKYPIVEENNETNFFSSKVLNGIKYFPTIIDNNIDFIKLDDYMIDSNKFYNVLEAFTALLNHTDDKEFIKKLKDVVDVNTYVKTYDGFLNKKTVFKVKDYE